MTDTETSLDGAGRILAAVREGLSSADLENESFDWTDVELARAHGLGLARVITEAVEDLDNALELLHAIFAADEVVIEPATLKQVQKLSILRRREGYGADSDSRAAWFSWVASNIGRRVDTNKDLTKYEAATLIDTLETEENR
jgi:hypothetical protein